MKGCPQQVGSLFYSKMNQSENTNDKNLQSFKFRKEERLCSKKLIDRLFAEGKPVFSQPIKIVYLETQNDNEYPVQAAFAVSKKSFKKAVQRNLLKRRMREAYRLNKNELYLSLKGKQIAVFFIFTAKSVSDFNEIEFAIKKGLKKLITQINAHE